MNISLPPSTPSAHPNLLLDRHVVDLNRLEKKETPDPEEWRRVINIAPPAAYRQAFERWKRLFPPTPSRIVRTGEVTGRFVTGLGAEGVFEVNIRLHHTYGAPFIPGTGLKGALHAFLKQALRQEREAALLFGSLEAAGLAKIYDAWWIPGSARVGNSGLALDVISVHHPGYYQGKSAPTDFDQPTPVHFLTTQGKFLFILEAPNQAWAEYLDKLLAAALASNGVGAKKTSGYGRFEIDAAPDRPATPATDRTGTPATDRTGTPSTKPRP